MKHIFSVTQINSYIHRIFESDYALKKVYLKGEVSNCKYHSSGHIYFTLKDEKSSIRCIMFSSDRWKGLTFSLADGQSVIVCGNISVYEQTGTYQMYAREIELSGKGDLYIQYEKRKQELSRKGYFDFERKKSLPPYPEKIGIVTALTGAAIEDIKSIAKRRNPGIQLYLYPAKVQGEGAAYEIAEGIRFLDRIDMDIIIIGRGGGSIEDLWAFNEMAVADAIYEAQTPIISGTGHEIDMTIADYCADVRAATPSAACELAIPDIMSLFTRLENFRDILNQEMKDRIIRYQKQYLALEKELTAFRPDQKLLLQKMQHQQLKQQLFSVMKDKINVEKGQFQTLLDRLSALSPTQRLRGGYVFVQNQVGKPVVSVDGVTKGEEMTLTFSDGTAQVLPISTKKEILMN
ncbi:MAG: exodeoxyribonuclease VII large subunit [Lachnospiraceae bacterium]|nr:exodeoxyribonuclease VII large subunit [Lachnospiraceae bacterium]MDY5497492.1 exodeoxyribonuclease VII large subunit [Anaerobutyricum sp.]